MTRPTEGWPHAQDLKHDYQQRTYSVVSQNCHHFVISFLNRVGYNGRTDWTVPGLCVVMLRHGSHTGLAGFLKSWAPFLAVVLLGTWLMGLRFVLVWLAGLALLAATSTLSVRQPVRTEKPGSPGLTVLPTSSGAATV